MPTEIWLLYEIDKYMPTEISLSKLFYEIGNYLFIESSLSEQLNT